MFDTLFFRKQCFMHLEEHNHCFTFWRQNTVWDTFGHRLQRKGLRAARYKLCWVHGHDLQGEALPHEARHLRHRTAGANPNHGAELQLLHEDCVFGIAATDDLVFSVDPWHSFGLAAGLHAALAPLVLLAAALLFPYGGDPGTANARGRTRWDVVAGFLDSLRHCCSGADAADAFRRGEIAAPPPRKKAPPRLKKKSQPGAPSKASTKVR